jgi:hypothetical protein
LLCQRLLEGGILGLGAYGGKGIALSAANGVFDLQFQHNTFAAQAVVTESTWPIFFTYGEANGDFLPLARLAVQDNILLAKGYVLYAVGGCSAATMAIAAPGYTWTNNAFTGPWPTTVGQIASCLPQGNGNTFPANEASLGYATLAGGDYRLVPSSPLENHGSDGKDVGADIDAINAVTA